MHILESGLHVDHCDRHCGTFLDAGELGPAVHPILNESVWDNDETVLQRRRSKLRSPVDDELMESIVLDAKPTLYIDRCTTTGGLWLDDGECTKLYDFVLTEGQQSDHTLSDARTTRGVWSYFFQLFSQLPITVWHPSRRPPLVTYGIVSILILTYLLSLWAEGEPRAPTKILFENLGLQPDLIAQNTYWQLFTYSFVHNNVIELLVNAYLLYLFGDNVEDILGPKLFLQTLVLTVVFGGLVHLILVTPTTNQVLVGMAAGLGGIMGTYLYLFPRVKLRIVFLFKIWRFPATFLIGIWVAVQIIGAVQDPSDRSFWAYLAGLVMGVIFPIYHGGFETITQRIKSLKPKTRWR